VLAEMNLQEWSNLTTEQRKAWLEQQSPQNLTALLVILGEMLEESATVDIQLTKLIDPSADIKNARDFTYNTLRDFERFIAVAISERHGQLFERAV